MPRTPIHPIDDPSPISNQPVTPQPPTYVIQPNPGLVGSFDKTNLDIENPKPNGGIPYKQDKDPTTYPPTVHHTIPERGYFATPGEAASKFEQKYSPKKTYLDSMKDYI